MRPERPNGVELLAVAEEILRRELLPALPRELHYPARMVARAMAVAARERTVGDAPFAAAAAALAPRLGLPADADPEAVAREAAQRIRAGEADPGTPLAAPVRAYLEATVRARVEISNPRYLGDRGG